MRLIKAPNPHPPKYANTFVLSLEFMSGDADADETKEFAVTEAQALAAATLLIAMEKAPEGGGWNDFRRLGKGWKELPNAWVVDGFYSWKEKTPVPDDQRSFIEWGRDVTCEGERASMQGWSLTWYDAAGLSYNVTVEE
jgi:hypothetical protein